MRVRSESPLTAVVRRREFRVAAPINLQLAMAVRCTPPAPVHSTLPLMYGRTVAHSTHKLTKHNLRTRPRTRPSNRLRQTERSQKARTLCSVY